VNGDWLGETNSPAMNDTTNGWGTVNSLLGTVTGGAANVLGALRRQPTTDQLSRQAAGQSNTNWTPIVIGAAVIGGGLLIVALIFRGR